MKKKQGILSFLYTEYKRLKLRDVKMSDSQIREELKLIHALRSRKSSMERKAILIEAEKRGITV